MQMQKATSSPWQEKTAQEGVYDATLFAPFLQAILQRAFVPDPSPAITTGRGGGLVYARPTGPDRMPENASDFETHPIPLAPIPRLPRALRNLQRSRGLRNLVPLPSGHLD